MNRVLILGATSPIARALALRFASDGARLYLAARNADEARRVAEDVSVRAGVPALSGTFDASVFGSHDEFIPPTAADPPVFYAVVLLLRPLHYDTVSHPHP